MAAVARFCTLGSVRTRGRRVGRWLEVGPLDWRRVSAPLAVPGLGVAWDTTLLLFFLFFLPFPDPSGPSRIPDLFHPFGVERGWVHSLSLFFPIFIPYIIVIIITLVSSALTLRAITPRVCRSWFKAAVSRLILGLVFDRLLTLRSELGSWCTEVLA